MAAERYLNISFESSLTTKIGPIYARKKILWCSALDSLKSATRSIACGTHIDGIIVLLHIDH